MTWVRVETSGGARYRAPSFATLPELEGFDKLFQAPLYMRQLHVFPYLPPTQQPSSANGTNPACKNTIANDADEVCSEMLVLLDQVELGGRLGLVSIAAGGIDTTEAALQVLLHYTLHIIRSTNSVGVQCMLDAITTLPPPDSSAVGDGDDNGEVAAANLPTRLREVRENDGLVHFDGTAPPQHFAEVFNQETAKCKGSAAGTLDTNGGHGTAGLMSSALHHFDNKKFKNRNFLYTMRGSSDPGAAADGSSSTTVAATTSSSLGALVGSGAVSSPEGYSTSAGSEKQSRASTTITRTEALYRRSFQYYIETNTVPLSLCFSTVVALLEKVKGTGSAAKRQSAQNTSNDNNNVSAEDGGSAQGGAAGNTATNSKATAKKMKKLVLTCQSNILRKPESAPPTGSESSKGQTDYWKAFARRSSKLNTFLLRAIQHLLKEALVNAAAASRRGSAVSTRRRSQPEGLPVQAYEGEEDDASRLKRYIEEDMWTSANSGNDAKPRHNFLMAAAFNASGLMFASPAFYGQLSHGERLLVTASAISQLLASSTDTTSKKGFYRWQCFPLLCAGAAGPTAAAGGNCVVDLCFLSMGDSLSLVFGVPQAGQGASDSDVPAVTMSQLTDFFTRTFFANADSNKENSLEATTGSLSVRSTVSTTQGGAAHFDFYNNKFLQRVQRQLCNIARQSTRPSPPSSDQVLLSLQNMEDVLNHVHLARPKTADGAAGVEVGWAALFEMLEKEETGDGAILREENDLFDLWEKCAKGEEEYLTDKKKLQKIKTKRKTPFCKSPLQCLCCNRGSRSRYLMHHTDAPMTAAADEAAEALGNQMKRSATLNLNFNVPEDSALRDGLFGLPLDFMFCMLAKDVCLLERDAFQPLRKLPHIHSCYWLLRSLPGEYRSARRYKDGDQLKHNQIGQYCVSYFRPILQQEHRRNGAATRPGGGVAPVSSPILNTFYPTSVAGATSFELVEDPSLLLPFVVQPESLRRGESEGTGLTSFATTTQVLTLPREVLFSLASLPPALQDQRLYRQFGAVPAPRQHGSRDPATATTTAVTSREAAEEEAAATHPRDDRTQLKCVYILYPHRLSCSKRMMGQISAAMGGAYMDSETFMDVEGVVTLSVQPIPLQPSSSSSRVYAAGAAGGGGGSSGGGQTSPSASSPLSNMDGYLEHRVLDVLQRQEPEPSLPAADRAYFSAENATEGRSSAVEAGDRSKKLETRIDFFNGGDGATGDLCAELVQCQKVVHSLFENVCY